MLAKAIVCTHEITDEGKVCCICDCADCFDNSRSFPCICVECACHAIPNFPEPIVWRDNSGDVMAFVLSETMAESKNIVYCGDCGHVMDWVSDYKEYVCTCSAGI